MDIVGITFDGELKDYIVVRSIKVTKWINPDDLSLDVTFRITIEHKYGKDGFRKVKRLHAYFQKEDFRNISIEHHIMELQRKILEKSQSSKSKEHKLLEKVSPLEGYVRPILTREVVTEDDGEKKRIRVDLEDYNLTEKTKKWRIYFPLKFKKSIAFSRDAKSITQKTPWYYDCLIGLSLVQTLKWNKGEFMPRIGTLKVWLQVPKKLYGSLSTINIQPVGHLEQMFFLEKEMAKEFRKTGQSLAQKDTLCINWSFPDISISSPPEEIEVTCGLRQFRVEEVFIKRFEKTPEDTILILRELLYMCKVQAIDFNYIVSGVSNKILKKILEIFGTMVFRKSLRPMEENLNLLLPLLEHFKDFPHGEEFFTRYDTSSALLSCKMSEDFSSDQVLFKIRRIHEFGDILDPDYLKFMEDIGDLAELTKRFNLYTMDEDKLRYKNEVLSEIDKIDSTWIGRLMHPDRYILYRILINWKRVIEREYKEHVPTPHIEAVIKTKHLAFADNVGIVLSIRNTGEGEAKDVQAQLLRTGDYDVVTKKSETKAYLAERSSFEPELVIKPRNTGRFVVSYKICYKDVLGEKIENHFQEPIYFIKKEISFQKIENPYIIGDIVGDSRMFYGREELLTSIIDNFKGKYQINPIFLYGQRRTGKTSVLIHLKKRLKDEFAPVFFTTQEIFGRKSFYQDLMEKIKEEVGCMDIEIPNIEEDPFDIFKNKFYAEVKQKLKGKKMIIMIDEYQKIDELIAEEYYDNNVIDFLNALVQDGEIKIILSGFLHPHELASSKWRELMRFFSTMTVSFLPRKDAVKLIREPVEGLMEYDEGGMEKIISLSGCHPYYVQLICHTMVEHHNHNKVNLIGYDSVINYLLKYFEKGENIFRDIIIEQTTEIERKVLFLMCNMMEKKKKISLHRSEIEWNIMEYEKNLERAEIEKALFRLERREIIRKSAEHPDYYEFTIALYRHWIRWNIPGK